MADKKIKTQVKMLIKAGAANPAPPVGSTLGPHGINLVMFCKDFNDKTSTMQGMVPVVVTIFEDRSYEFILKTPPVAELVKQALGVQSGAGNPLKETVGTLTVAQVLEIAQKKMPDLNCFTVESAAEQVKGTCKSMGVKVAE
ncbi:MAG: 50S ribosomal protein L11 [bacterium]